MSEAPAIGDAKPVVLAHPGLGAFAGFFSQTYDIVRWPQSEEEAETFTQAIAPKVRAAIVISSDGLPKGALEALPALEAIACFGAGYDCLDLAACAARGIRIGNCPAANAADVADVAMGLLLSVSRHIAAGDRMVRAGLWKGIPAMPPPRALRGMKLGVVGFGAIGQEIAKRAAAFGLDIRYTGPRPKPDAGFPYEPSLLALAGWADVLALALRSDPGTERMIDAAVLQALGADGILINVARGSVVDEEALITALKAGRLAGAGLDVFAEEPTPAARWEDVPNVTLTPHLAGATRDSVMVMVHMVLANLAAHFSGQPMPTRVA